MEKTVRYLNIAFLLLLAIGFGSWLLFRISNVEVGWAPRQPEVPVSIIENSKIMQANSQGQLSNEIIAEKIIQFENPDKTELLNARLFIVDSSSEQPWQIDANQVLLTANNERADLMGDVQLYRSETPDQKEITVNTEAFTWWSQHQFGETTEFVTVRQPGLVITGTGALVDTINEEINLLTDVNVNYDSMVN